MKTIYKSILTILSILIFSNFQCEKDMKIEHSQVEYLSYGTSFGECLGYCKKELVVSGGIVYTKRGWDINGALPDSSCSMTFITSPLPGYLDKIDLDAFLDMDATIGCPDCADGGAEWLELSINNDVKRVTFEYMNEPDEFLDIAPSLRELMESFNECRGDE